MLTTLNVSAKSKTSKASLSERKAELQEARKQKEEARSKSRVERFAASFHLANVLILTADSAEAIGRNEEAAHYLKLAIQNLKPWKKVLADRKAVRPEIRFENLLIRQAGLLTEAGQPAKAAPLYRQAAREIRMNAEAMDPAAVRILARTLEAAMHCYRACCETDLAVRTAIEALNNMEIAFSKSDDPKELRALIRLYRESAALFRQVGDAGKAAKTAERAISLSNRCFALSGDEADVRSGVENLLEAAEYHLAAGNRSSAEKCLDLASQVSGSCSEKDIDWSWLSAKAIISRAALLTESGDEAKTKVNTERKTAMRQPERRKSVGEQEEQDCLMQNFQLCSGFSACESSPEVSSRAMTQKADWPPYPSDTGESVRLETSKEFLESELLLSDTVLDEGRESVSVLPSLSGLQTACRVRESHLKTVSRI